MFLLYGHNSCLVNLLEMLFWFSFLAVFFSERTEAWWKPPPWLTHTSFWTYTSGFIKLQEHTQCRVSSQCSIHTAYVMEVTLEQNPAPEPGLSTNKPFLLSSVFFPSPTADTDTGFLTLLLVFRALWSQWGWKSTLRCSWHSLTDKGRFKQCRWWLRGWGYAPEGGWLTAGGRLTNLQLLTGV